MKIKKLILFFLITVFVFFETGCAPGKSFINETYDSLSAYDSAKNLFKRKQYDESLKEFQSFVKNYPDTSLAEAAMFYIGNCYKKKGMPKEAINAYQRLITRYQKGNWVNFAKSEIENLEKNM